MQASGGSYKAVPQLEFQNCLSPLPRSSMALGTKTLETQAGRSNAANDAVRSTTYSECAVAARLKFGSINPSSRLEVSLS